MSTESGGQVFVFNKLYIYECLLQDAKHLVLGINID